MKQQFTDRCVIAHGQFPDHEPTNLCIKHHNPNPKWPPCPLIGPNIFSFFPKTLSYEVVRLGRCVPLGALKKCCYFL